MKQWLKQSGILACLLGMTHMSHAKEVFSLERFASPELVSSLERYASPAPNVSFQPDLTTPAQKRRRAHPGWPLVAFRVSCGSW